MYKNNETENVIQLFIDESYGDEYCAVCAVCIQGEENAKLIREIIRQMSIDPAIKSMVCKENYHYSELSIGARQALTGWIAKMPLSVYIAVTRQKIQSGKHYDVAYGLLLKNLLIPLFNKFQNRSGQKTLLGMNFENISDKTSSDVEFFTEKMNRVGITGNYTVSVVTKHLSEFIFLPDFFLGYVKDHLIYNDEKNSWTTNALKLLSGKIGLLLNFKKDGTPEHFSRGEEVDTFLS